MIMNEGEPKPKSKLDILNERMVHEAEQDLLNLDNEALARVSEPMLESERERLARKKIEEDQTGSTAHFKRISLEHLRPYDLWNSLRVMMGEFDGDEGKDIFDGIQTDILALLEKLERGGKGTQQSRRDLYAFLANVIADHNKGKI